MSKQKQSLLLSSVLSKLFGVQAQSATEEVDGLLGIKEGIAASTDVSPPTSAPTTSDAELAASASLITAEKSRAKWQKLKRKLKNKRPTRKKWICCSAVDRTVQRGGNKVFRSYCYYKAMSGKQAGGPPVGKWISLGVKKPTSVTVSGKRIKFCSGSKRKPPSSSK